ncbi:hypothetical protein ACTXT7_001150 [Hymenolepis weldensis]
MAQYKSGPNHHVKIKRTRIQRNNDNEYQPQCYSKTRKVIKLTKPVAPLPPIQLNPPNIIKRLSPKKNRKTCKSTNKISSKE